MIMLKLLHADLIQIIYKLSVENVGGSMFGIFIEQSEGTYYCLTHPGSDHLALAVIQRYVRENRIDISRIIVGEFDEKYWLQATSDVCELPLKKLWEVVYKSGKGRGIKLERIGFAGKSYKITSSDVRTTSDNDW